MTDKIAEFKALFEASEWSQAETARRLRVDRATVSRYISGEIEPPNSMMELFKMILLREMPEAMTAAASHHELAERPPESEAEQWRRRAKESESREAQLREGLRVLLERTSPNRKPVEPAPALTPDEASSAKRVADALGDERDGGESLPPRGVDAPTGRKGQPSSPSSPATKVERPSRRAAGNQK